MAMKVATYEEYSFDSLNTYAGIDCIVTLDLLKELFPTLVSEQKYNSWDGKQYIETRAPPILTELLSIKTLALEFTCDLRIVGMCYDIQANKVLDERMQRDIDSTKDRIFAAVGKEIPLSGNGLVSFLYLEKGFKSPIRTAKDDDSASGDALLALYEEHKLEWLMDIKRCQDLTSMHNGFVKTYIDDYVKNDGRIHCQYHLNGTSSHRISSSDPNMLNMPSAFKDYGYGLRNLYTSTPGYTLLAFDFSSCEVKVLAAICRDPNMIHACVNNYDFHSFSAAMIMGIPYEEFLARKGEPEFKKARQDAKAVTFGILYGSSVGGVAYGLGVSVGEAQAIIDSYFNAFPLVKEFIDKAHKEALANEFVFSPLGQRKAQFGAHPMFRGSAVYNGSMRNAQNVQIQGPASTLGLICFAMLNRALKDIGGRAVLTVYDSVEFEVPYGREAEAVEMAFYYLDDWPVENFEFLDFPIGCDGELGPTFGTLKHVHRGISQEECEAILAETYEEYMPINHREYLEGH